MKRIFIFTILLFTYFRAFTLEQYTMYNNNQIISFSVPKGMGEYFIDTCYKYKIPILYAYRLIESESKWRINAKNTFNKNKSIDHGIMQLNSNALEDFRYRYNKGKVINPYNWKEAMDIGLHHLSVLHNVTGSWYSAIASYNMGLTKYRRYVKLNKELPSQTKKKLSFVFSLDDNTIPTYIAIKEK